MHALSASVSALLLLAAAVAPAQAAIVKYEYTATVTSLYEVNALTGSNTEVDTTHIAGPAFAIGDTWTGSIAYDDQMPLFALGQPPQPAGGSYLLYTGWVNTTIVNAQAGFAFTGVPGQVAGTHMQVYDQPAGADSDFVSLHDYRYNADGPTVEISWFQFQDGDGVTLAAITPPSSITLTEFPYATAHYSFSQGATNMQAFATITSMTRVDIQSPVPEPATWGMLGLGLGMLVFMSRKQRRA